MSSLMASGEFVLYAAYAAVFFGTVILARMLLREQESREAQENLAELGDRKTRSFLVRVTRPFFNQYLVPMIRGKRFWDSRRLWYKRKLVAAGLREELNPDEFIAFKFFLIVFFPLIGALLKAGEFIDVEWYMVLGSGIAGWFYPDFWMKGRLQKRQKQILRAMPFIVDLLALSMEAGLDFIGAIGKVVEKAKTSPLVEEFGQLLKEIKVGSSRQEALREMAIRIDMQEVNSFVAILISADQMGASIGKILRQQSEQIRNERMLRAEKEGAKAATKIMIPIVFIVLPAVLLIIMGPFILSFMTGGGE
ncbi:MAG TPA: pilus assembly protein TadC [Bdellovibrionales bacterium]|nr:pilus assembly protein TadC [Bdellovibrionales bacterium]HCM41498.1 pilus assembly protein TadC [Bdellovibrionales bacterium]